MTHALKNQFRDQKLAIFIKKINHGRAKTKEIQFKDFVVKKDISRIHTLSKFA